MASLLLVGNPNVGKSAVFGALTGRYVTVSNYPGTTVEVTRGEAAVGGRIREIVDTPGINTLIPQSEDEQVTRDILLTGEGEAVVQVGDMKNLRRVLLISLQLAEMGLPFVLDLNMADEARSAGIEVNTTRLAELLGVPVVSTIATQKRGLGALQEAVRRAAASPWRCSYPASIERAAAEIEALLPAGSPIEPQALALMIAAGDETLTPWLQRTLPPGSIAVIDGIADRLNREFPAGVRYAVNRTRMAAVDRVLTEVLRIRARTGTPAWLERISQWSTHPVLGLPFMALTLVLAWLIVGLLGAGLLVDLLQKGLFDGIINPALAGAVRRLIPVPLLRDFLVGDFGLVTMALTYAVAIVLPIVGSFFIFFGLLEDSGYMPRLAVMVNRLFRRMGLSGKAVLPMALGLGCDTMATLTARIMETRKQRLIVTLLLALGVPCSAQLGVILGLLGGIGSLALLIWLAVVAGVLFTVGWLAARVLPGEPADFILELPPLRLPQPGNLMVKTLARIEWYLKEAVPIFVAGTFILFVLDATGLLAGIERAVAPVLQGLLDLPAESTGAFLIGFLRRDYGAAGLFDLYAAGRLDPVQTVTALVTMTLFIPCIANFLIIIKEQGVKIALGMVAFITPVAIAVGALVNALLRLAGPGFLS